MPVLQALRVEFGLNTPPVKYVTFVMKLASIESFHGSFRRKFRSHGSCHGSFHGSVHGIFRGSFRGNSYGSVRKKLFRGSFRRKPGIFRRNFQSFHGSFHGTNCAVNISKPNTAPRNPSMSYWLCLGLSMRFSKPEFVDSNAPYPALSVPYLDASADGGLVRQARSAKKSAF